MLICHRFLEVKGILIKVWKKDFFKKTGLIVLNWLVYIMYINPFVDQYLTNGECRKKKYLVNQLMHNFLPLSTNLPGHR